MSARWRAPVRTPSEGRERREKGVWSHAPAVPPRPGNRRLPPSAGGNTARLARQAGPSLSLRRRVRAGPYGTPLARTLRIKAARRRPAPRPHSLVPAVIGDRKPDRAPEQEPASREPAPRTAPGTDRLDAQRASRGTHSTTKIWYELWDEDGREAHLASRQRVTKADGASLQLDHAEPSGSTSRSAMSRISGPKRKSRIIFVSLRGAVAAARMSAPATSV